MRFASRGCALVSRSLDHAQGDPHLPTIPRVMLRVESIAGQVRECGQFQLQPRTIYSRTNEEYKRKQGNEEEEQEQEDNDDGQI